MTRAVVATAYGGPEVLSVVEVQVPHPGPGEVVVDVRAAGVNPIDWKVYSGSMGDDPAALPMRLGFEAAGVVAEAGPDAIGPAGPVRAGDEVLAFRVTGGYAERLLVPAEAVVPKPAGMDWPAAAGLLLSGVTAVHALAATGVGPGDTLLVHGGAGAVGVATVQLAVARGARVIATARPVGHRRLREFGAEPVAYGDGLEDRVRALAPDGVDAAVDTAGTDEAVDVSLALVGDRGRIATGDGSRPSPPSAARCATGSRPWAAGRVPTRVPRCGPPPGSTWSPRSRRAGWWSRWPAPTRWPRPPRRTRRSGAGTPPGSWRCCPDGGIERAAPDAGPG